MKYRIVMPSAEEVIAWSQWLYSIPHNPPENINPAKGGDPNQCQNNADLFFLVGTTGGDDLTRRATVSADRYIFFPIIETTNCTAEFPDNSEDILLGWARNESVDPVNLQVRVDGVNVQNLQRYLVETSGFGLALPENNIFGAKSGSTRCVSVGYYFKLRLGDIGWHIIEFGGQLQMGFYSRTRYTIRVS